MPHVYHMYLNDMDEPPIITVLLLGDPECGKSTFLSYVASKPFFINPNILPRQLSQGQNSIRTKTTGLPLLHDLDQPFIYDVRMYHRTYKFHFYDTASPKNYTLLHPNFVIICYDISDRRSLVNVQHVWRKDVIRHYAVTDEKIPVMLLGLKRDLRVEGEGIIYPQEVGEIQFRWLVKEC